MLVKILLTCAALLLVVAIVSAQYLTPSEINTGQTGASADQLTTATGEANPSLVPAVGFMLPVTRDTGGYRKFNSTVVSGLFHTGDDYYNSDLKVLASYCGDVVAKIANGVNDHGFGNTLIIRHGSVYTLYGHMASFGANTDVGKHVARGQIIGKIGKTGSGSNDIVHLHFELKASGILGNPTAFGNVGAGTKYGYVPKSAGTRTATSAEQYGYFEPSNYYGASVCQ